MSSIDDKLFILLNIKNKQISLNNSKNSMELSELADEQTPSIILKNTKKNIWRYRKKRNRICRFFYK